MKKKDTEHRDVLINFFVTPQEKKFIKAKMEMAGIKNQSAFLRKMALDGYVVKIDMSDVKEATRLLKINSNNLNQYAKKANETGYVSTKDIEDLKKSQEKLWDMMGQIEDRLSTIS